MTSSVVVEEEQWFGAAYNEIIDAHRHQIDTDGVVLVHLHRQFELGADTVGAGDQHRLFVAIQRQLEQGAEPAQPANDLGAQGAFGVGLDAFDQAVAGVDVHTGIAITEAGTGGLLFVAHRGGLPKTLMVFPGEDFAMNDTI